MKKKLISLVVAAAFAISITGCAGGVPEGCELTQEVIDKNQANILKTIEKGGITDFAIAFVDTKLVVDNPKCFDWRVLQLSIEKQFG